MTGIAMLACAMTGALVALTLDEPPWGVFMSAFFGLGIAAVAWRIEEMWNGRKG